VQALSVELATGRRKKVACDAVVLSVPPSPAYEVARHAGARVVFSPELGVFVVETDAEGRTRTEGVFVAGDALGGTTAARAADSGRRAAAALLREAGR
jgi:sarcosine oxidase subunit alpha